MKVVGIIAEYNPFHNGHALLIEKARLGGATHIVAVMSGNYVQRGEPAIFSYRVRTKAALECGADLVLQLPCVYAVSGAQRFARAGVEILDALGCVDEIVFGSECGDINEIVSASDAVYSDEIKNELKSELEKGVSFAAARENALRKINQKAADIIKHPNNILGVEYVAAIRMLNSRIVPVTYPREGVSHDEEGSDSSIASASYIRKLIRENEKWTDFLPPKAGLIFSEALEKGEALTDMSKLENSILYKLRTASAQEFACLPDISEGIENRIANAAQKAVSLDEVYDIAKTKRYSHARIRRIVMNAFLGITASDAEKAVPYIRVTGFNTEGTKILRNIKGETKLPVITKAADLSCLNDDAKRLFEIECRAGDLYSLCLNETRPCGAEKTFIPVNIK